MRGTPARVRGNDREGMSKAWSTLPGPPAPSSAGALASPLVPSRRVWGISAIALFVIALVASACGSSGSKSSGPRPTTGASAEPATQPISDAVPAGAKRLHFEVGPITVEPGQNNIAYTKERIPQPTEDGWIVGITPNIRKADGTVPPVDVIHLHHGVWLNMSAHDVTRQRLPERFFAVGVNLFADPASRRQHDGQCRRGNTRVLNGPREAGSFDQHIDSAHCTATGMVESRRSGFLCSCPHRLAEQAGKLVLDGLVALARSGFQARPV